VRFNDEQNQIQEHTSNNNDNCINSTTQNSMMAIMMMFSTDENESVPPKKEELWYGPTDYKNFKTSAANLAKEIIHSESGNKAPHSYHRVLLRTYKKCCQCHAEQNNDDDENSETRNNVGVGGVLTEQEFKHLKRWMDVSTSRLGVEKLSLRHLARDRVHKRNEMMQLVFEIQEMAMAVEKVNSDIDDQDIDINDLKAEFIRNTCLAISRGSRLFALHMGMALAASLHHD
jgi:hypothetical protein